MRRIHLILLLPFSILLSCSSEELGITPRGNELAATYYSTEEEVEEALFSAYDVLGHQKAFDHNGVISFPFSPYLVLAEALSDDAYAGGQDAGDGFDEDEFNAFNISTGNGIAHSIWRRNYFGVFRTNLTIERATVLQGATEEFQSGIMAEAKFLRALFYFEQVRFFENIVMPLKPQTISEANIPQSSPSDVLDQIASDLVTAGKELPENHGAQKGRATKWAAKSLLARVYLYEKGTYGNGITADGQKIDDAFVLGELEDVINNSGHDLLENFEDVFSQRGEFSLESVFEVVYDGTPVQGDWGSEHQIEGNLAVQMMGPRVEGSSTYYRGWSFAIPTHKIFEAMEGDPRREHTILTQQDLIAESAGIKVNTGAYQHTGYYNAKYTTRVEDRGIVGTPELHNKRNYRVIRFSDVLLMAAEIGKDVNYINRVRQRVGLSDLTDYTEQALFHERRMELAGEGIRYWDVLRRGQDFANQELTMSEVGPNYTGDAEVYEVTYNTERRGFLPIPQVEMDISNGVLKQNTGY